MQKIALFALSFFIMQGFCYAQVDPANDSLMYEASPEFPGGIPNFTAFVKSNLQISKKQKKELKDQRLLIQFKVNTNGKVDTESIMNVEGMSSVTQDEVIEQVIQIIKNSPIWKPGTREGEPIEMRVVLPLLF